MNIISSHLIEMATNKPVSIVLVGTGGMGSVYLTALLENKDSGLFRLEGAVDPYPERCPHLDELRRLEVPLYASLEAFTSERRADLAIISSPIQFHCGQTSLALSRGSNVLCEKPAAATIQEVRKMCKAMERAKRQVAVGYQWSSSAAIQDLKRDIQKGLFGRAKRLKCLYLWPRDEAYYLRNDWAGRQKDEQGRWVLDSPMNNAMAHDLHNMFYVLGEKTESSARPVRVEAELCRAYPIQNFDTGALRCFTETEVEVLFYVSHACRVDSGPVFLYEFERGTVSMKGRNTEIRARLTSGQEKSYGCPDTEPLRKMWLAVESVGSKKPPLCGLEAAMSQTLCLNGAQDSAPEITDFPRSLLLERGKPGQRAVSVRSLEDVLEACFEQNLLPSELGLAWSKKGRLIDLSEYGAFPGGGKIRGS